MGVEIEAKMRVPDLDTVRRQLRRARASLEKNEFETNIFFDTRTSSLKRADRGLRLRIAKDQKSRQTRYVVTLKGPQKKGKLKTREEIEFTVDDPGKAIALFRALGFEQDLSFEKRRESWHFAGCEVTLDELPILGTFVEIEGPSASKVMSARKSLGLAHLPLITTGYIKMLATHVREHHLRTRKITFPKSKK